jgi:hypothetical protein
MKSRREGRGELIRHAQPKWSLVAWLLSYTAIKDVLLVQQDYLAVIITHRDS